VFAYVLHIMITNMLTVPQQATCYILSCGRFPGVWILCADVSEQSICSIFIGGVSKKIFFPRLHHLLRWNR